MGPVFGFCEYGNEPLGSINSRRFSISWATINLQEIPSTM